jgi:zinc finger SWIM domain-containing protein 3
MSESLAVGMTFSSLDAARDALLRYTVLRGESYKKHKQTATCYIVVCRSKDQDCPYRIRFTLKKGGDWALTIYIEHICSPETHTGWRPAQSVQYLTPNHTASFNLDRAIKPKQISTSELQNGNQISYNQSWRALEEIKKQIFGDEAESFKKIPSFLENLSQVDPQAYWRLETQNNRFFRLFIAPGATQEAFRWCRPFIALDGTFVKTRWNLTILIAATMDGDNQILPLAWGFVPTESNDSWSFFLSHFRQTFPSIDNATVTTISDRSKGLEPAMTAELSHTIHLYCCYHLQENLMKFHPGGQVRNLF